MTIEDGVPTVAEYRALRAAAGWPSPDDDTCRAALAGTVHGVRARSGNELVGMARLVGDRAMYLLVVDVVVDPGYQGGGLGRRMVERLTAVAAGLGVRRVLLVAADDVVAFYAGLGFERDGSHLMRLEV